MQNQLEEILGKPNAVPGQVRPPGRLVRVSPQLTLFDEEMLIEFSAGLNGVTP